MFKNENKSCLRKKIIFPSISERASSAAGCGTCHEPHRTTLLGNSKASALPSRFLPGEDVLEGQCSSQQTMLCFLYGILLGLSYGMLFSCQHSLAHGTLSPPCLCFPPVSQGSSQVLPCQALPMAPAPLELVPAPVPAHRHFFKLMTAAKGSPAAFKGVNASLPMWDASLWILGEPGWFLQSRTRVAIHPHPGIDETIQVLVIH